MSDTPRRWSMVINCADADRMSEFWCGVLGLTQHPRSSDDFRVLTGPHGNVALQVAKDPVTYRDQMHVDVYCPAADLAAEMARVVALGATYLRDSDDPADPFVVYADPEGNRFCLCPM
jgi:catechol 2,3-dioxygenase-like lactoylglutathione lyase family enzyme